MKWLDNAYRWVYSRLGGRPFTYMIRDIYHQGEFFVLTFTFVVGFVLGKKRYFSWKEFAGIMLAHTLGFCNGHLFWGKRYKENQQDVKDG